MASLQFTTKYNKNTNLMLSPTELRVLYFYGIKIESDDGTKYSNSILEMHIRQAQEEIEKYLGIKLFVELITETQSYFRDSYFRGFPIIQTDYLVNEPLTLNGLLGKVQQISYPETWLQARSNNNQLFGRRISIVPTGTGSGTSSGDVILSGVTFQTGIQTFSNIPDYWTVQYKTGFDTIEWDLFNVVGMVASIPSLAIAGDIILGAGIASQSLSIDGLSQSIGTTSSATSSGYASRILEYRKSIKETLSRIMNRYKTIRFVSM